MAEWMRHGPKDVVETDDDSVHMTEQELCHHIKSQLDFGKKSIPTPDQQLQKARTARTKKEGG